MSHYSDPTGNTAIGAVDRELAEMRRRAERIGTLYRTGRLSDRELLAARREFTGIYRRLLREALEGPSGAPADQAHGHQR